MLLNTCFSYELHFLSNIIGIIELYQTAIIKKDINKNGIKGIVLNLNLFLNGKIQIDTNITIRSEKVIIKSSSFQPKSNPRIIKINPSP